MKRREFITLVGGAAAAWPLAANAQKGKLPLIGVLNPGSTDTPGTIGFYGRLRELGYAEGLNIAIERRYGDWNTDRFQQLAADLVRLKVDVIVVISTSPARAAKQATSVIPIVVAAWPILSVMGRKISQTEALRPRGVDISGAFDPRIFFCSVFVIRDV
jgi:putative ABC transport system substrate-binding protein